MHIGMQTWGSEGDVQPFIALAAGLVQASHKVTLLVTDNIGRDYSAQAHKFGFSLLEVKHPAKLSADETVRIWHKLIELGDPVRQAKWIMELGFDPVKDAMFAAAMELCANNDAVIGHFFVYPLRVAAERTGKPIATVHLAHNCLPTVQRCPPGFPNLGRWGNRLGWKLVRMMVNSIFLQRVNALRESQGLTPERDVMTQTWVAKKLNLVAVSPTICEAPTDWEQRHQVCGFLNPPTPTATEEIPAALGAFMAAGTPPLYFTFGSMVLEDLNYQRELLAIWSAATERLRCRAIVQLPWSDLNAFVSNENIFKVQRLPHARIFPRCAVIVHHGGAGTTQSSLLAGRPSVVIAHLADQFFWGAELERLGAAGPTLKRKQMTPKRLAQSIERVLSTPAISARAAAIGKAMSQENGTVEAVALIEKHLLK